MNSLKDMFGDAKIWLHNLMDLNLITIAATVFGIVIGVEILALLIFNILGYLEGIMKWR